MRSRILLAAIGLGLAGSTARAEPVLAFVEHLSPGQTVAAQAEDLNALVAIARPQCVWEESRMVWVWDDVKGARHFTLKRAVRFNDEAATAHCGLIDGLPGDASLTLGATGAVPSRENPAGISRLATDSHLGSVYQIDWMSDASDGGESIILLCSGNGRWSVIGAGPLAIGHWLQLGQERRYISAQYGVQWTGDAAIPVRVSVVMTQNLYAPAGPQVFGPPSLTIHRQGTLAGNQSQWDGLPYLVNAYATSLDDVAAQWDAVTAHTQGVNGPKLASVNPRLGAWVPAGSTIVVPDQATMPIESADVR